MLAPQVQAALVDELRIRRNEDRPLLTPREREVLEHISQGLSAPEIGRKLHVSPATVKTHLQSLYEQFGVSERAAAVAGAMRRGCSSSAPSSKPWAGGSTSSGSPGAPTAKA